MALDLCYDQLAVMPHISHLRMASFTQVEGCIVGATGLRGPNTALGLKYYDSGRGGPPVPRPFIGGPRTGFHAMPSLGDDVLVAYQPKFKPTAVLGATNSPQLMDVLLPGESYQVHPDGRIANYLRNGSPSNSIIFQSANTVAHINALSGGAMRVIGDGDLQLTSINGSVLLTSISLAVTMQASTINLTGTTLVTGTNTFTVNSGATHLGGSLAVDGLTTLNNHTTLTGGSSLTVGTGPTSLGGTLAVTGNTTLSGQLIGGSGTLPTATNGSAVSSTTVQTGSTNLRGRVTVNTVGSPISTNGVTINFSTTISPAPLVVLISNESPTATRLVGSAPTTTGFTVNFAQTPPGSSAFTFDYLVVS